MLTPLRLVYPILPDILVLEEHVPVSKVAGSKLRFQNKISNMNEGRVRFGLSLQMVESGSHRDCLKLVLEVFRVVIREESVNII